MAWVAALKVPGIIAVYLGLNFVLNFGNKHLLGQFRYPIVVILAGTLCYAPLAALLIVASKGSFPSWRDSAGAMRAVVVIGVVHAIGTAAQAYSLSTRSMSVGLNQVIKSCTPAVTLVFSWLLQRVWFHWSLIVSTVLVVAGTVLTTFASSEATFNGVASSAVSALFGGLEVE
jgi:drug/metabolite transporter (DMT)-like permease